VARLTSGLLLLFGALFLIGALTYATYWVLNSWLMERDRYLRADDVAAMSVPAMTLTPSPVPTSTPVPPATPLPTPTAPATPPPTPKPPPAAVQIRIPAIGVKRSIIELPRVRDRRTSAWTWDTDKLFRRGRNDLVGHWQGSAHPGEAGNMILVGHNYGYGYNGVFLRLGSLRPGQKFQVVNKAGKVFTYRVTEVERVRWRRQTLGELTQHLSFLSPGGPERVTLVSCAGAEVEPFPERIYVVGEPVR
jgi:LPXTG-site transpeptidase (sortase) family protein